MNGIIDFLCDAVDFIIDLIVEIIEGIISFVESVYNYFLNLPQEVQEMIKFIIDIFSEDGDLVLQSNDALKEKLKKANVFTYVDGKLIKKTNNAFLEAALDENTGQIRYGKVLAGNEIDDSIKTLTHEDGIGVLEF